MKNKRFLGGKRRVKQLINTKDKLVLATTRMDRKRDLSQPIYFREHKLVRAISTAWRVSLQLRRIAVGAETSSASLIVERCHQCTGELKYKNQKKLD